MPQRKLITVLGVDPGLAMTGIGIVQNDGAQLRHIHHEVITTDKQDDEPARLRLLARQFSKLLKRFLPDSVAVEKLFFQTNVKTAMAVGQARGVILLEAGRAGIPITEHTPMEVKQAVTSYGKADKQQIQQMLKILLNLPEIPRPDDAADALAVAITALHSSSYSSS